VAERRIRQCQSAASRVPAFDRARYLAPDSIGAGAVLATG
jgi:hypothetical protein